jgi:hypothetical protein
MECYTGSLHITSNYDLSSSQIGLGNLKLKRLDEYSLCLEVLTAVFLILLILGWHSCRCLTGCPPRGIPKVVSFGVRGRRDQELEGARNTRLRQVRAARSVTPYVLYGLYCLLY